MNIKSEVKLTTNRNLQFNYPVPNDALSNIKFTFCEEFESIRYTTITCGPDEFVGKKWNFAKSCQKKKVTTHLFEYTTQLIVESDFKIHTIPPIQIMLCLKEKNAKKLNSHRWSFNSFAALLKPKICILLDVGTKPLKTSIYQLWKAFDRDPHVGSACGEIKVDLGRKCKNLLNPLVTSQNFEYKMSNILDKPSEFVFGYISVLPGAFSAYRYEALMNGPLEAYFKDETMDVSGAPKTNIVEANMYLAEDPKAETDVPDNDPEFIFQRRRWLNGSFFTAFYSIAKFTHIWNSGQPLYREILLQIQFFYNGLQLIFNWFSLSTTSNSATDPFKGYGDKLFDIARLLYLIIIVISFICSMGNHPQGTKLIYTLCIILFTIIMAMMLYCSIYIIFLTVSKAEPPIDFKNPSSIQEALKNATFQDIIISSSLTYLLYLFSSLIHCESWHMFSCLVQYILLIPSYVNILMIYAFCNTHDVSWGTKGDNINLENLNGASLTEDEDTVRIVIKDEDLNNAYQNIINELLRSKDQSHGEKQYRNVFTKKDDYYRLFRTYLVLS
ncbi:glycosyltransferase family 2 protein [Gigaspora margarita]|uniref:Chitin synthase n=1 Tax=Gigaspora margarita TaxID=4874 RepID=A0A8H4A094_GIGMA|nr:glycosyltransferase family 2 protein [Gigaspora margarita]